MAFTVFQSGSNLYGMNNRGTTVSLALPTGVTIDSTLKPRFSVFGNYVIIVNSPNRAITVDANLNVRNLAPAPPVSAVTLAGVAPLDGVGISGTYEVKQTFIVRDQFGAVIAESDFGPASAAATITNQDLQASGINLSADTVSGTRLYRTTTGTSTFFQWIDLDGNKQTSIQDDLSDAGLSTLAAPLLGSPPNMSLLAEFKSRLFGVAKANLNRVIYTETGFPYSWPAANFLTVPRTGSDNRGVTGFARRRDALGVGRSNGFYQITGTSDTNLAFVNLSDNCGIEAPDSVVVYRDVAYFLWKDGVYKWDNYGLKSITEGKISRWFTRNGTFNLSRLQYAFAHINPLTHKYRLFLSSAGSAVENCWIEYDFVEDKWYGPHVSHAFNPTSAFQFSFDSGMFIPMIGGSDGFCKAERLIRTDDTNIPIDFDVVTTRLHAGYPDDEKYFGELSVSSKPQSDGILNVQCTTGELDQTRREFNPSLPPDTTIEHQYTMNQSRSRLGRVGAGKAAKLRFRNNQVGQDVVLRGYEMEPVFITGKR